MKISGFSRVRTDIETKEKNVPKLSRIDSTIFNLRTSKGAKTSRASLSISSPLKKSPKKETFNNEQEEKEYRTGYSGPKDPKLYFAFGVENTSLIEQSEEKLLYFTKQLDIINCKRIIDDEASNVFEMNIDRNTHIIIHGAYSKLFELFRLICYINVFGINSIKTQLMITNSKNDILLILPLVNLDITHTYEKDNNIIGQLFSPRAATLVDDKIINRKQIDEEEDIRLKTEELEARHKQFLKDNGLLNEEQKQPTSPKSVVSGILREVMKEINLRGENLKKINEETDKLEYNTANLSQNARTLRIQTETKVYGSSN